MPSFTELTAIDPVKDTPDQRPLDTIHGTGANERRAAAEEEIKLDEDNSLVDTLGSAWDRGISATMYDAVQRKWEHEPEEGFDPTTWVNENSETLVGTNLEAFNSVRSHAEADALRADQLEAQEDDKILSAKGYTGVAAQMLTGFIDPVELGVGIATGGTSKLGSLASNVARSARLGLAGGAASGGVAYTVDPLASPKQIVYGALSGAVLGGAFGGASHLFSKSAQKTRDNYSTEVDDLPEAGKTSTEAPVYRAPRSFSDDVDTYTQQTTNMSVGAASFINGLDVSAMSPRHQAIYQDAVSFNNQYRIAVKLDDVDFDDTPAGRTAKRFSDALADGRYMSRDFKTDFDRMAYNGGTIEQNLAYNLFESAEGRIRNTRSAAIQQHQFEAQLASQSMGQLEDSFSAYARKHNMGLIDRNRPEARDAFDREVISELEARFHEGKPVSTDPIIVAAADAVDNNYAKGVDIGKGREGETSVLGFENMEKKSGFFNHKWNGKAMRKLMARGVSKERMEALLSKGYAKMYPDMDEAYRTIISKAVIRRALAREDGIDTNMLSTLDSDGQEYLRELLNDSGYDDNIVDSLIESIRGRKEEQGQMGTTKARVQVDLRTEDGDISLLDLVDTNLIRTLSQYNRSLSGAAALARKGIASKADRKDIIEAALAERRASGLPAEEADRRFLEDAFTYFDSGPIGGGVDKTVSRLKRVTNLGLLNQMGLTQAGETGAQIAAVGMETWQRHAKGLYKEMRKQGPEGPIIRELRPIMGEIGNEHMLFRDDLMLDELHSTADLNTFLGKLDFALGKGQRIQGYASGFFHVRAMQQKIAVASMADKVMQRIRDGVDERQVADIGLPQSVKKYIDDGTVVFAEDGFLDRLNLDKWDAQDAEDFGLAMHRHTSQVVQRAMAGEENMWMHKTVGSLMMHLKSFPILAMRKQSMRATGVSTPLAVATLTMGLATAGIAYEAKQIINGKFDRVTPMAALEGAGAMSNMTGWVPMLTDPAAAMLGMNDLKFSQYGRHNLETGIISTPAILPTVNKMLQVGGAVNPMGDLSKNERIRVLQATPIVGNLYGFSALFNAMKD